MEKQRLRDEIAAKTKEYLSRGGVIKKLPRVIYCPRNMGWVRERGMDWTSWKSIAPWTPGKPEEEDQYEVIEREGCYIRTAAPFEGANEDEQ